MGCTLSNFYCELKELEQLPEDFHFSDHGIHLNIPDFLEKYDVDLKLILAMINDSNSCYVHLTFDRHEDLTFAADFLIKKDWELRNNFCRANYDEILVLTRKSPK